MYSLGYLLKTDEDFAAAMNFRIIVSIIQKGKHMGSGCINAYNEETVKMASGEFNKAACEFKVVESADLIYSKRTVSYRNKAQ